MNHAFTVEPMEEDLGFALIDLPSTDEWAKWDGEFRTICAVEVEPSTYVMKINSEGGVEYWPMKWGIPNGFKHRIWMPYGKAYLDAAEAIHQARLDMNDVLKIALSPLPSK